MILLKKTENQFRGYCYEETFFYTKNSMKLLVLNLYATTISTFALFCQNVSKQIQPLHGLIGSALIPKILHNELPSNLGREVCL